MKKRKRLIGVLLVAAALIIMQLPVSEADASTASASDFKMEGSTLARYRGTETKVSVPDTVEVIGASAFEGNTNIEQVVLPDSVKRIEEYAFWGCDNLDQVVLGKGLTAVGDYAFAGCKGMTQMTIPKNVTSIGVQAFGDCVNLRDISIPAETSFIHQTAFDGCYQLTIHCDAGTEADAFAREFYERQGENPEYEDVSGYEDAGTDTDAPVATAAPEPSAVPEPVITPVPDVSDAALLGSTKVVGNRAVVFIDSESLPVYDSSDAPPRPEVQAPIADFSAAIPEGGIPKFAIVDGAVVADQAYYRDQELGTLELPSGIREIGEFAYARSSLREGVLPSGVTDICYGAFYHCDLLETVAMPDTVMNVEPKAFSHTAWTERFLDGLSGEGDFLISGGVLAAYRGNSGDVVVPEGVRVIAAEAFMGHEEIVSVTLPESLRVIGEGAFENCTGLREAVLNQGLMRIKDRAFQNTALGSVKIPASVEEMGLWAFDGAEVTYEGSEPKAVFETSASRLSNEAYRKPEPDAEAVAEGVVVEEPEGASAVLEGAARSYVLQVTESSDPTAMEHAFRRVFGGELPAGAYVCDMRLADSSGIPLTKLGRQFLTVVLPLPDSLKSREIRLFQLDRNGQLEELAAERVLAENREAVRFRTNYLSSVGLCPTGETADEPVEISVETESFSAPPKTAGRSVFPWKYWLGGCLLLGGILMILSGKREQKKGRAVSGT